MSEERTIMRGKAIGSVDVGKTPLGSRSNVSVEWTVSGRDFSASMKTTDYLLTRPDGISVINSLGVITTKDNETIAVKIGGYGLVPINGKMKLKGFITYETASTKYGSYNSRVDVFDGDFFSDTGALTLNCYELKTPMPEEVPSIGV
ncbi:MAG: hypothetical protein JRN52_08945 [Nitrososphaerota archaeon]|nr:hypothetical protein [Nitrososphaerota archaeon]